MKLYQPKMTFSYLSRWAFQDGVRRPFRGVASIHGTKWPGHITVFCVPYRKRGSYTSFASSNCVYTRVGVWTGRPWCMKSIVTKIKDKLKFSVASIHLGHDDFKKSPKFRMVLKIAVNGIKQLVFLSSFAWYDYLIDR